MERVGPETGTGDERGRGRGLERYASAPPNRRGRKLPWILFVLVACIMVAGRLLEYRVTGEPPDGWFLDSLMGLAFMSFPAVGALIASRHRSNAFAWLLLGVGGMAAVLVAASGYAAWAVPRGHDDPLAVLTAWLYQWLWFPLILTIPTLMFLLFPTGRYASPFWKWVGRVTIVFIALATVPGMLQDRLVVEYTLVGNPNDVGFASLDNPIGIPAITDAEEQFGWIFAGALPLVILSLLSLVFRYRRAEVIERQQMKWVGVAAVLFGFTILVGEQTGFGEALLPIALMMLPASMAVSILKYRLYEIDVIVNRALVYGALSALLVGAYLAIVFALQNLLGPITRDSDIAVAGSTLAVAAMFRPLRSRVQHFIDRRFYRRKYDAQHTLEVFSSRLRDEVDLRHLASDLADVVTDTMQPAYVSVWLRGPEWIETR